MRPASTDAKFKLLTGDDGYVTARTLQGVRKLIDVDKVFMITGISWHRPVDGGRSHLGKSWHSDHHQRRARAIHTIRRRRTFSSSARVYSVGIKG